MADQTGKTPSQDKALRETALEADELSALQQKQPRLDAAKGDVASEEALPEREDDPSMVRGLTSNVAATGGAEGGSEYVLSAEASGAEAGSLETSQEEGGQMGAAGLATDDAQAALGSLSPEQEYTSQTLAAAGPGEVRSSSEPPVAGDTTPEGEVTPPPVDPPPVDPPPVDPPPVDPPPVDPPPVDPPPVGPSLLRHAISHVLFVVNHPEDGITAYKLEYTGALSEIKDPSHPAGFIGSLEAFSGGEVLDYFIKSAAPPAAGGGGFYTDMGSLLTVEEQGSGRDTTYHFYLDDGPEIVFDDIRLGDYAPKGDSFGGKEVSDISGLDYDPYFSSSEPEAFGAMSSAFDDGLSFETIEPPALDLSEIFPASVGIDPGAVYSEAISGGEEPPASDLSGADNADDTLYESAEESDAAAAEGELGDQIDSVDPIEDISLAPPEADEPPDLPPPPAGGPN